MTLRSPVARVGAPRARATLRSQLRIEESCAQTRTTGEITHAPPAAHSLPSMMQSAPPRAQRGQARCAHEASRRARS
jgi:hypothetical protein